MNAEEFVAEVGKIAAKSGSDLRNDPLEATCWYIAYHYAEQMREMSTKDLARWLQEPWAGLHDLEDVQIWLDDALAIESNTLSILFDHVRSFYPDVSDATVPPDKSDAI